MKGFSSMLVMVVVAALLVLGGWYWSQNRGPVTNDDENMGAPATGGETEAAGEAPAPTTSVAPTTVRPSGNTNIDSAVTSITASVDAYSNQANSEDGTEVAGELTTSLNNQNAYVE